MSSSSLRIPDNQEPPPASAPDEPLFARGQIRVAPSGKSRVQHYRRPVERPLLASERGSTTILLGGLTRKHEEFIKAVFEGSGHKCEILPTPDQDAFQVGKEFGNNGQCSPAYFTAGSLIQYLKNLETSGLSCREIADRYVFFTAGSCGPCRFGMYAAEYRMALQNAGFEGFRVIRFQQDDGVRQQSSEPGLRYTLDFGLGMLKSLLLGDVLNDLTHAIRPFETVPGETNRVMELCIQEIAAHLREYKSDDLFDRFPSWLPRSVLGKNGLKSTLNTFYRFRQHLRGEEFQAVLERCRERIDAIDMDRTRVKPIVKIIGEFWAQTTEGDGNYRMFDFLEREGAQVQPEAIGTWIAYLLNHARLQMVPRRGLDAAFEEPEPWDFAQRFANELSYRKKSSLLAFGEWLYARQYHRVIDALGGTAHRLVSQRELARLADPHYRSLARGGEGYLEVGKNIYYTTNKLCHMVLSLKPFGCMPSSQSDGVQSAVVSRFREMIFLPVETSGEGETNAHSRVQMALGEAKAKAKSEFQQSLAQTGRSLEEIRAFTRRHPELRSPLYQVPHHPGVAGVAANFVLHVGNLMAGRAELQHS